MIQRRNQLQNDILSNNLNNPINMLGNNFAMMYNNSNNQYFTNPHQINNGDFRMNMQPNSNFIYAERPKKNQRTSQPNGYNVQGSNVQNQNSNQFSNMNLNNVINMNSVMNPNPYSNNLSNNAPFNSQNNNNGGNTNGNNGNQQPKKDDKKTTSTQNVQGGNKKR
jgi:hypothetical protein